MENNNYIIKGGEEGKKRLEVIASLLNSYTKSLLEIDGPLTGRKFLDVGCGGGSVTLKVAALVGDNGSATGVDFDEEIINLAKKDAVEKGYRNVSFERKDVNEINYTEEFDITYARFLLSHMADPASVIERMIRSVKKGGRIVVEDIDFSGHFCFPESKAFNTYLDCYTRAARNNHQDPNMGLSLFSLLGKFDLHDLQFDVIQPSYHTGPGKWMAYLTFSRIRESIIKQDLITEAELDVVLEGLKAFIEDERTIISLPRIFRVWGIKA